MTPLSENHNCRWPESCAYPSCNCPTKEEIDKASEQRNVGNYGKVAEEFKKLDAEVIKYCKKLSLSVPQPWAYPGDLIFDVELESFLICGAEPKDVAELRRRSLSFKKVDLESLKIFLIAR